MGMGRIPISFAIGMDYIGTLGLGLVHDKSKEKLRMNLV